MNALVRYTDGIISGMPEDVYHGLDRLSQSGIKQLLRSPAHFKEGFKAQTVSMKQGSLIDVACTEPARLESDYFVIADDVVMNARHKAFQEIQAEAGERVIVKQKDMDAALRIRDAVYNDVIVSQLLEGAVSQQVALWTETMDDGEVPLKARLDYVNEDMQILIDLKTTQDARDFARTAGNYGYYVQDACYRHGWHQAGGFEPDSFVFIVVEREPPFGIKCFEIKRKARELGWKQYMKGVELYARCKAHDAWPGYDPHIEEIDLYSYVYNKEDD